VILPISGARQERPTRAAPCEHGYLAKPAPEGTGAIVIEAEYCPALLPMAAMDAGAHCTDPTQTSDMELLIEGSEPPLASATAGFLIRLRGRDNVQGPEKWFIRPTTDGRPDDATASR